MPRATYARDTVSTIAVDKAVMERIRETAKQNGLKTLDLTNQLLTYALDQGKVEISVKTIVIHPSAAAPASSRKK